MQAAIQTVNDIGQITLGRHLAGQQVTVEARDDNVWLVKMAEAIPEGEQWFHTTEHQGQFRESMAWLAKNPPSDDHNEEIFAKLANQD